MASTVRAFMSGKSATVAREAGTIHYLSGDRVFRTGLLMQASRNWVEGLLRPKAFPHPTGVLELMETHISWVVLTGEYAYKLKKPVDFGFVNFSTIELREEACREELRLNQRWQDSVYLEVCPVTGTPERPRIGGAGAPFEYAVKMRQFDQDMLLSHCIETGRLQAGHLERFALDLARFHQRVDGSPDTEFGTPEVIREAVMHNFQPLMAGDLPAADRDLALRIRDYSDTWFAGHAALLQHRHDAGFVRDGHGDLHLNNMLLMDGRIALFDCLEFNPALRWGDVMNEIAFLVMDLENHGHPDLARRFLNAYIEHSGDHAGLAVLPFYVTYRAMVRAKVDQLTRTQTDPRDRRWVDLLRELEGYLDEAMAYARATRPRLAIMSGVSGTGKTFHSLQFVEHGFIRIRSDFERKRLAGSPLDVPVQGPARPAGTAPPPPGELYSRGFTERTYRELVRRAEACLVAGYSVLIDATCLQRWQRRSFADLAARLGVPARLFVLEHDVEVLERRIRERGGTDLSDADVRVLHLQLQNREPLDASESRDATVIDERRERPESVIRDWLES